PTPDGHILVAATASGPRGGRGEIRIVGGGIATAAGVAAHRRGNGRGHSGLVQLCSGGSANDGGVARTIWFVPLAAGDRGDRQRDFIHCGYHRDHHADAPAARR